MNYIPVVIAALALVGTACVADDPDPNAAVVPPGGTVEISLTEFGYTPSSLSFVAGSTVTITLINDGFVPHEFMLGQTPAEGGGYDHDLLAMALAAAHGSGFTTAGVTLGADDHDTHAMTDDEMASMGGGGHAHSGAAVSVEPGGRVELEFHIPADASGDWEFGCFLDRHYEAGMHGTATISEAAA